MQGCMLDFGGDAVVVVNPRFEGRPPAFSADIMVDNGTCFESHASKLCPQEGDPDKAIRTHHHWVTGDMFYESFIDGPATYMSCKIWTAGQRQRCRSANHLDFISEALTTTGPFLTARARVKLCYIFLRKHGATHIR